MDLNTLWFLLITILFTGFFFLEGFDFGVGILLPFLGKSNSERREMMNAIGPFWDGNEVWMITAGGAMFAAFPNWYATLFSGFYLALLLLLVALILRGTAIEFRNRAQGARWQAFWDWAFFGGSLLPGFLWGVAIANIMEGVPIDAHMNYVGGFWNLLNPYALLGGLAFVGLFTLHGVLFLSLRTEGNLQYKAQSLAMGIWLGVTVLIFAFVILGYVTTDIFTRLGIDPGLAPLGAGAALLACGWLVYQRRSGWAFCMTGLTIILSTLTIFQGLFPRVMISSLNHAWDLTIYNASSSPYTLTVMSWIALSIIPIVLAYQAWTYWIFRKRLSSATTRSPQVEASGNIE